MTDEYTPTTKQIAKAWHFASRDYPFKSRAKRAEFNRWLASVERAAAVETLREAAFTGYFGTSAQSTLLRMAERLEADRIESEGPND